MLWWRHYFKPLRIAAIAVQRIARGFLVRLRRLGMRFARLQARVKAMLARRWYLREIAKLRRQERLRWLREQADMVLVAEDAVELALEYLLTKDGMRDVAMQKKIVKVHGDKQQRAEQF